jgi:hypothetical protein
VPEFDQQRGQLLNDSGNRFIGECVQWWFGHKKTASVGGLSGGVNECRVDKSELM